VVVVGGTVLAAWGLLYVLAVVAMVAIVVGVMTNDSDRTGRGSVLNHADDPYGTVTNVFGQKKSLFESDSDFR
jgi:hypothetical protein